MRRHLDDAGLQRDVNDGNYRDRIHVDQTVWESCPNPYPSTPTRVHNEQRLEGKERWDGGERCWVGQRADGID